MVRATRLQESGACSGWMRRALLVALFAVSFGYVESAVVVYLRVIYDPVRAAVHPDQPPGSLLPLITLEQLCAADPVHVRRLGIELGRELATMIVLVSVASLAVRRRGEWIAMFMIGFGIWDIVYYLGLKAMIGFPESLLTWDILFLLPVPWVGPVLAPVIVSVSMIGAGLVLLADAGHGRPFRAGWCHWAAITAGGLIIIAGFCQDHSRIVAGVMPERFNWLIFAAGEAVGLLAFAHAWLQGRRRVGAKPA